MTSQQLDWTFSLVRTHPGASFPENYRNFDGDGMIVQTTSMEFHRVLAVMQIPMIEILGKRYHSSRPFVGCDNGEVGASVARHFEENGFFKFAFLPVEGSAFFRERVEGFQRYLSQKGFNPVKLPMFVSNPTINDSKYIELLGERIAELEKPVAIFAANDEAGIAVTSACRLRGISVPESVAVIGCENDVTACEFSVPQMSSVAFNGLEVGMRAGALLDQMMRGKSAPVDPVQIPPLGIVTRETSDKLIRRDPLVGQAFRLMDENIAETLDTDKLATLLGCSRSTLHRRFRLAYGKSPGTAIRERKLEKAKRLLVETHLTIEAIASMVGYSQGAYLQTAFLKSIGQTPGQFRAARKL